LEQLHPLPGRALAQFRQFTKASKSSDPESLPTLLERQLPSPVSIAFLVHRASANIQPFEVCIHLGMPLCEISQILPRPSICAFRCIILAVYNAEPRIRLCCVAPKACKHFCALQLVLDLVMTSLWHLVYASQRF
jgi:hypothetical protein